MDPGTAYAIVTAVAYPVVKLGGLGASIVGPWLGFVGTGVVKGSIAAAAQSSIPNVVAGSVFAGMQAATATTTATTAAVGSVVGLPTVAVGVATYGAYRLWGYFR